MNLLKNFEITGQLSGQLISEAPLQQANNLVLGLQKEIGLIVLASNTHSNDQSAAKKTVEIMLDDMEFNISQHLSEGQIKQSIASNCLHESLENINEYFIEQYQSTSDDTLRRGISITALQVHNKGISCCMHGNLSSYKLSDESFDMLGSKVAMAKSLGINPSLTYSINEQTLNINDLILLCNNTFIDQLGAEFIRMTLSRFNDNLYMAIKQINARVDKKNLSTEHSFVLIRKINEDAKKRWFG